MKQTTTVLIDDYSLALYGEALEAASTHVLEFDGQRVELDLSEANGEALAGLLREWLDAGRAAGSVAPAGQAPPPAYRPATTIRETRRRNGGMRAYAAGKGAEISRNGTKPYHPAWLQHEFAALPAEEQEAWMARAAREFSETARARMKQRWAENHA